jgi:hypothetical protein
MRQVRPAGTSGWGPLRVVACLVGAATTAVVTGVVVGSGSRGSDAQAEVISAARLSLAAQTAMVRTSGTMRSGADAVAFSMQGSVDFVHHDDQLRGTTVDDGNAVIDGVTVVNGVVYEQVPDVAQLDPGKAWVAAGVSDLASQTRGTSSGGPAGDPSLWLSALAREGNAVSPVGTTIVDGASVNGYAVTLDPASIEHQMTHQTGTSSSDPPGAAVTRASSEVDVDPLGHVVRQRIAIDETMGDHVVTIRTEFVYSHYGAAVSISAPPAAQVVPLSSYLRMAKPGAELVVLRTSRDVMARAGDVTTMART